MTQKPAVHRAQSQATASLLITTAKYKKNTISKLSYLALNDNNLFYRLQAQCYLKDKLHCETSTEY